MNLLERTYQLLDQSEIPVRTISEGSDIPERWVRLFAQRRWESPGVVRVQQLHDYLSESQKESSDTIKSQAA